MSTHLLVQRVFVGDFSFQLVVEVVQGGGFALHGEVALLQSRNPLLRVLLLGHGLRQACQSGKINNTEYINTQGITGLNSNFQANMKRVSL